MAKTFPQAITDVAKLASDPNLGVGGANVLMAERLLNMGVKYIMNLADWNFNKTNISLTSVASQQDYLLPYNLERVDYVNVYANNLWYTPTEIKHGRVWRQINYVTTNYTDVPLYWFYSNSTGKISIFPIPASAGNTIKVGYTKKIRDLSDVSGYSAGHINTVADSNAITGVGTTFTARMVGQSLKITSTTTQTGDFWYEINGYTGATSITVKQTVPVTLAGGTTDYTIQEMIPFAEGFEDIAVWFSLDKYYQMRELPGLANEYSAMWRDALQEMKARDQRSADGLLKKETPIQYLDPNADPWAIKILPLP
jgi:hypothetical protein